MDYSIKEKIYTLPDELCEHTGIRGKWVSGETLSLSAYRPVNTDTQDIPSEFANIADVNIFHLTPEFIYKEPILRSLIAESNGIFLTTQELKQKGSRSEYLKISRTYRSIIRACLEKLRENITSSNVEKCENYITIFYSIECIWHLCEILLIDPLPSNLVVPQLLDWIRFHFSSYEINASELLQIGYEAELNDLYWPTINGLILQGQIDVVRSLLRLHTNYDKTAFQTADQILKTMPIYNVYNGMSLQKFKSQYEYWISDAHSKIQAGMLGTEPCLEDIIMIITGDQTSWFEQLKNITCWYEILPGYLFYTQPYCKYYELGSFANEWFTKWSKLNGLKHLDKIILSIMENDIHQLLYQIQNMCDNQWFVTHLIDLLYHSGQLKVFGEQQNNVTELLRESLLYDFGTSLVSYETLWNFGIDYLEYSSPNGLQTIELLLSKIYIKNEKHALKLLSIAKTKKLVDLESDICRIQARKSLTRRRFGNALEWAIRSKDNNFVTSIADLFLDHYCKTGEIMCPDVLKNIGAKMFISPRLVFLIKYYDFHQYYKEYEFAQAAELIVNLLDSKITPEYFWPSLLADTIPLLESNVPIIPVKETYIILHHLESQLIPLVKKQKAFLSKKSPPETSINMDGQEKQNILYMKMQHTDGPTTDKKLNLFSDYRVENIEELIKLIRLATARNLARSLVIEKTVSH